jgi:hypothetical protein
MAQRLLWEKSRETRESGSTPWGEFAKINGHAADSRTSGPLQRLIPVECSRMNGLSACHRRLLLAAAVSACAWGRDGSAQQLQEPVFRVTNQGAAAAATAGGPAVKDEDWFDLEPRAGDHPLAPSNRLAHKVLKHIDAEIQDYSCMFVKRERVDGTLSELNYIEMEVLTKPFSVHMKFIKPKAGQECLFVEGANDNKLIARAHGWRGKVAGVLTLDPNGSLAMDGNRHPITKAGIRNTESDMKYGECDVKVYPDEKNDERPAVMIEVVHPQPRKEFKFHIARMYIDREYKIPVRFEEYAWPTAAGEKPELIEQYLYTRLKINNGFKASDFAKTNPNYFK